jgi:hypothetical protein
MQLSVRRVCALVRRVRVFPTALSCRKEQSVMVTFGYVFPLGTVGRVLGQDGPRGGRIDLSQLYPIVA